MVLEMVEAEVVVVQQALVVMVVMVVLLRPGRVGYAQTAVAVAVAVAVALQVQAQMEIRAMLMVEAVQVVPLMAAVPAAQPMELQPVYWALLHQAGQV